MDASYISIQTSEGRWFAVSSPSGRSEAGARLVNEEETPRPDRGLLIDLQGGALVPSRLSAYRAGFTAVVVTVSLPHVGFDQTLRDMYQYYTYFEGLRNELLHVLHSADIAAARERNQLAVLFGLQGAGAIRDVPTLTILHKLGLRVLALTYNERSPHGDGCMEMEDRGLTLLGKEFVRELNRLGIVLDLSHASKRTAMQAMEVATAPPIYSHSNPYSMTPNVRCIDDEQIDAVAELGGVVAISCYSPMCYADPGRRPSVEEYLDRVDYVVDRVGIDHVAIGSDLHEGFTIGTPIMWRTTTKRRYPEMVGQFDHHNIYAEGFSSHTEIGNVLDGLQKRGYPKPNIEKFAGGNALRVLQNCFEKGSSEASAA